MAELELRKLKNKISGNINYSCYFCHFVTEILKETENFIL